MGAHGLRTPGARHAGPPGPQHHSQYEDVAALADPGHRRQHLTLACVTALCQDIAARGRTPSWTCSRDNRPSRLLAWLAGFRLTREYVHYGTGSARRLGLSGQAEAA
ncbi:GNAT family N-acetyltransferase [Streptomyces sp. NPDC059957]|uniref:GNAT family N-acetyltransferase n=1 Tax=unclassified Streptomyces TaxID=2593676 RepID=UPI00365B04A3